MKTTATLLITLGLASQPMWVQAQTSSTLPQDTESQSGSAMQPEASEPAPSAPASGASVPGSDTSSGGTDAMQSEASTEMREGQVTAELPEPQTQGDVTYLCGGVGEREQAFMKQQAKDYELMLTFATRSGAYLAGVDVGITDPKGTSVLQAECDGPLMLVNLPRSGNYRVRADAAGYTLNQTVRVTDSKRQGQRIASVVLTWPQRVAEAPVETGPASGASGASGERGGDSKGSGAR